jgi:hypothetical protein
LSRFSGAALKPLGCSKYVHVLSAAMPARMRSLRRTSRSTGSMSHRSAPNVRLVSSPNSAAYHQSSSLPGFDAPHMPQLVGPPSFFDGKRPHRPESASTISFLICTNSSRIANVTSNDSTRATSSGVSSGRNSTSHSTSAKRSTNFCSVARHSPASSGLNHVIHDAIVVSRNCGAVFRTTTARERRLPSTGDFACNDAMYTSLKKLAVVLPEPTGPMIQSKNNSPLRWCLMNSQAIGGGV